MQSGQNTDETSAQVQPTDSAQDSTVKLKGEEEGGATFDEKKADHDAAEAARVAALPSGSTRSGAGKLETVTVKPGDTLKSIAARKDVYGSQYLYPLILQANRDRIKDPNHLEAGVQLVIPRDVPDPKVEIAKEQAMTGELLDVSPLPGTLSPTPAVAAQGAAPETYVPRPVKHHSNLGLWILLALMLGAGGWWLWSRRDQNNA
ncbi:MAG TPA: LysM peptidoglycan-binding domain-containing protein [bacterium]|nr:LysM peptidoglycan-binding domain-containing protein [bacterium]